MIGYHICQRFAQSAEYIKIAGANGDRDNLQFRTRRLQERQLHFDGVFGAMRGAVLFEGGEAAQKAPSHVRVGRYFAQRSLPRGISHDGKRTALPGVIGAENHAALRDSQARIDGAGDAAAVDVSRMWSDACDGVDAAGLDW